MCLAICGAATASAQEMSDESLARIRERLQQAPSALTLYFPTADFSVYVEGRRPLEDIFEPPPWVSVPDEFAAPTIRGAGLTDPALPQQSMAAGGGVDPGIMAHAISRSIRTRAARAEVRRAIAEYCSAHREEPGADQICGEPPR
jgi:hypothetical protein